MCSELRWCFDKGNLPYYSAYGYSLTTNSLHIIFLERFTWDKVIKVTKTLVILMKHYFIVYLSLFEFPVQHLKLFTFTDNFRF
jgi:hypothetical protein